VNGLFCYFRKVAFWEGTGTCIFPAEAGVNHISGPGAELRDPAGPVSLHFF
jgi:hypothetical protein